MTDRQELEEIVASHSLLRRPGGYILASGKHSPYYFDLKLTTLSKPRALYLAAKILWEKIRTLGRVDAVGGLTSGADPLIIAVSQFALSAGTTLPAFFVRDEQKSHGTQRIVEGMVEDGMTVVILDDVITTGNSVLKAIVPTEKRGARIAKVFILVDREEGGIANLQAHGYDVEALFSHTELKAYGAVPRSAD